VVLNTYSTAQIMTFSAFFSSGIKRTKTPGYLRVFSATTNQSILVLDASNSTIIPLVSGYTVMINMPVGLLPTGDYYILFDYGILKVYKTANVNYYKTII
jgi:hypothetical protein